MTFYIACYSIFSGTKRESEVHLLTSSLYDVCQRGDITMFVLRYHYNIGSVVGVRLWHDNSGKHPAWYPLASMLSSLAHLVSHLLLLLLTSIDQLSKLTTLQLKCIY